MGFDRLFAFERDLAEYTGAPYVVLTDGCTHALELCLRHDKVTQCEFSAFTYISVIQAMMHLGVDYVLTDESWGLEYDLHGTRIVDSARRLERNMYRPGKLQCLSFGIAKPLRLGRVGCVLTDDYDVYHNISRLRSDGRDLRIQPWSIDSNIRLGYHYAPTLELCELGSQLLKTYDSETAQDPDYIYPDCRKITIAR
jgi:dTDP-4-amino-4,6-dideoxygalactose transaminase